MLHYILSLDQGTTSSRAILYDQDVHTVATRQKEFRQLFPEPGWVEHDAMEIWESQLTVAREAIAEVPGCISSIAGIGITNQRETTVIWDRKTGQPIHHAIVWQDRRTAGFCKELTAAGHAHLFQSKTGLVLDAYFSATKIRWLLDHVDGARDRAEKGELAFGTIDTWLVWNLTGGKQHITDVSNASRTMIFNIHDLQWDEELLRILDIPVAILPEVVESSGQLGITAKDVLGAELPIGGIAGDQQAALFGQLCTRPGMAKCTYGTGCFLVANTGDVAVQSNHNLLTTIGWKINGQTTYALEGSVFVGGAAIQWLRDGLGFFSDAQESEELAASVEDNGGVYFVPALTGLGAPYWDQSARGMIVGITRGTTKAHITRAALEAIGHQVNDVLETMAKDRGGAMKELRIDGGAVANDLLVQFQADIAGVDVLRPANLETTALGAAFLAGLGLGLWSMETLETKWEKEHTFQPQMDQKQASSLKKQWQRAIERSKGWIVE